MTKPDRLTLRSILGHLTPVQFWGLAGAFVGLLAATFSLGFSASHYLEDVSKKTEEQEHERRLAERERIFQEETGELERNCEAEQARLNSTIAQIEADLGTATAAAEQANTQWELFQLKSKFLDHHLRYSLAKAETSNDDLERARTLFVSFVHRLWRAQEEAAVNMAFESRSRTERVQIPVRVTHPVNVGPLVVDKHTTTYEWQERTVEERVIKTVTFSDGTSYIVPYEIASEVHRRG